MCNPPAEPYVCDRLQIWTRQAVVGGSVVPAHWPHYEWAPVLSIHCCSPLLCCAGNKYTLPGLMAFTGGQNVTFGSDFPFAPNGSATVTVNGLDEFFATDPMTLWRIGRGNALNLIPQASTPASS